MPQITKNSVKRCGGLSTIIVLAFGLMVSPAARAQLPGGSAVDEYTESVPGAGGDHPSGGGTHGGANNANGGSDAAAGQGPGFATAGATPASSGAPSASQPSGSFSQSSGTNPAGTAQSSGGGEASGQTGVVAPGSSAQGDPATTTPVVVTVQPASREDPGGGIGFGLPLAIGLVAIGAVGTILYRHTYPDRPELGATHDPV